MMKSDAALTWGSDSDMETLAALVAKQRNAGHRFAAAQATDERPEKDAARRRVLDLFTAEAWPESLEILTMPGAAWIFESQLLRQREALTRLRRKLPLRTSIRAIESDPAIFASALTRMPTASSDKANHRVIHFAHRKPYAVATVWHPLIRQFNCARFDDYAAQSDHIFDAAWLDFTGFLTRDILTALVRFWPRVRVVLVVTFLAARYGPEIGRRLTAAEGDWGRLLADALPGARVASVYHYADGAPMVQVELRQPSVPTT